MNQPTPPHTGKGTVTRLADYELLDQLGEGGMGIVFRAQQLGLGRLVALKVMNTDTVPKGHETLAKERFINEAHAMAKLHHPNIIPIYDVGQHLGVSFFSMRLIPEGSLSRQIGRFARNLEASTRLMADVARALEHAHRNGVIHRDLKPQNILVDAEGKPSVTDFGLAKIERAAVDLTESDQILGSPAYMAPEQAKGESKHVTGAADIFSLGVVLYQLLTGKLPFDGRTRYDLIHQILEQPPTRPSLINPDIDDDLDFICLKCLEKVPAARYQSGAHLADDLANWAHEYLNLRSLEEADGAVKTKLVGDALQKHQESRRRAMRELNQRTAERAGQAAKRANEAISLPQAISLLTSLKALLLRLFTFRRRPIRVVLADNHPIVRAGIRAQLEKVRRVEIVGEANDGREAVEVVQALRPDVVFMDITMPGLNGIEATARISRDLPEVRVVMLSRHEDVEYYWGALKAGASGYMLKRSAIAELGVAVKRVVDGEVFLSREISRSLGKTLALKSVSEGKSQLEDLTERQREILRLIAQGRTIREIAVALKVSVKTVKYHNQKLMERLAVRDAGGLIRCALKLGLIEDSDPESRARTVSPRTAQMGS